MIVYLDTSALVPLLIDEPTSPACATLWDAADEVVSTRLLYVEATAALAQAHRLGRLDSDVLAACLAELDRYWREIGVVELDADLMAHAAVAALDHGLRGYDAVHCAAACAIAGDETVAATGDTRLRDAWGTLGLGVYDTTRMAS